jgi:hypothetical protein
MIDLTIISVKFIFLVTDDGCEKYELLSMGKVFEHLLKSRKPLITEVGRICTQMGRGIP